MARNESRIAVLIDSDNVSERHVGNVLAELTRYGTTSIRRMYGDWTSSHLSSWKTATHTYSIQPIQQFSYTTGKNSTDSALIIDAMDLLHQNQLDVFAIVSSDSDFTRLASRLRESGAHVLGFGERKTPKPFVNACDAFTYLDTLEVDSIESTTESSTRSGADDAMTPSPSKRATTQQLRTDRGLVTLLRSGITADADDAGWASLAAVGATIRRLSPDFDSRNWGYAKLGELVEAVGLFEVKRIDTPSGGTSLKVRILSKR